MSSAMQIKSVVKESITVIVPHKLNMARLNGERERETLHETKWDIFVRYVGCSETQSVLTL